MTDRDPEGANHVEEREETPAAALEPQDAPPEDQEQKASGEAGQAPEPAPPEIAAEPEAPPPEPAEVAAVAEEFLEGLVAAMNLDAEVATRIEDDTAYADVTGGDLGVLIGRRGQTLDGLQEITRTAVQRRLRTRVRLMVDVEGYRSRRQESLAEYARSMARRAKERGTEIELEPMNAYERKIVHDAVSEVEGATSFSEGEEPYRKVIVRGA